jgi:hypothetical protein
VVERTCIEFSAKDASILARVAQYERVPAAERRAILEQADSSATRIVGRILIGDHVEATQDIHDAVVAVQNWVRDNRGIVHPSVPRKSRDLAVASFRLRVG